MPTMVLPEPVERVLCADALECARRAKRYKFGRLRNHRIVAVLRNAAVESGVPLTLSDQALVDAWFAKFDEYLRRPDAAALTA